MSLIIKGINMPKSCGDCNFYYTDYEEGTATCLATSCYVTPQQYNKGNRDSGCPLVEIHTPHGRPIDADRLKSMIEKYHCNGCDNYNGARCSACCVDDCFRYIDDIPTIIEAEGVNENS